MRRYDWTIKVHFIRSTNKFPIVIDHRGYAAFSTCLQMSRMYSGLTAYYRGFIFWNGLLVNVE